MIDETMVKIADAQDRIEFASILLRNGYTCSIKRRKKNGKAYDYFVSYKMDEDAEIDV